LNYLQHLNSSVEVMMNAASQRLIDAMETYSRMGQMLRLSQEGFWTNLPLTLPQIRALGLIACAGPAGRSGRDLASQLGVGPSAVTPLVDRLVEHAYVSRHEDVIDRRIQRLRATAAGVELLQRMASLKRDVLAEIVAQIAPEDLPVVEHGMEILVAAVERLAHESERAASAPSLSA
jgi:DNA-binding MarR family transcriptional regulator